MENPSTSKQVLNFVAAIFLGVLAIAILNAIVFNPWFKNIRAEITEQPYARTVTVTAEGKVSAKPDLARVTLAVVSEKPTVKAATEDSNAKMNKIIDAVKALNIDPKDITTSGYNLSPTYKYPQNESPQITGYTLRQELTVKVRKLEIVDQVLDTATRAGANEVGQLSFDIDDTGPLKNDAREKAFAKAKEKAEQMANAAGVNLGRVVTFSESFNDYPMPYANFSYAEKAIDGGRGMGGVVAPSPAIEPGSKELTVNVSVTYEIE